MTISAADVSGSPNQGVESKSRIPALDCLRGLMLAIVLADHIDALNLGSASIGKWTLIGIGFSDASDVFVYLSGFVFGYAYGKRIKRDGRWSSLKHGLFRTFQIYLGYLVCSVCVGLLQISTGMTDWSTLYIQWLSSTYLANQSSNVGILCLYVVLLPWLLLLFVSFGERWWFVVMGLSLTVYCSAQIAANLDWQIVPGWGFQPLAWQFLMVLAALLGRQFGSSGLEHLPRSRLILAFSVLVLLLGLAVKKSEWLPFEWLKSPILLNHQLVGKSNWAPLRGLHLLSLVYTTIYFFPMNSFIWSIRVLEPIRACGRHSLTVFCVGVLLTQVASNLSLWIGNSPLIVWIIVLDAAMAQFLIAWALSYRRRRSTNSIGNLSKIDCRR